MNSAQAFIAFLRCEAKQAEERAKNLRATAATIEANGIENRGRKRGSRKRERPKARRGPTAYTLFVHENYEMIKKAHEDTTLASRDVISLVAQRWAAISEEEKQMWHFRAQQYETDPNVANEATTVNAGYDEELPSLPPQGEDDDGGGGKKRARKQAARGVSAAGSAPRHSVSV